MALATEALEVVRHIEPTRYAVGAIQRHDMVYLQTMDFHAIANFFIASGAAIFTLVASSLNAPFPGRGKEKMTVIFPKTIFTTIPAPSAIRELAAAPKAATRSFVSCANLVCAYAIFHSILLLRFR